MNNDGWIGVDLDGTLAEYHGWKGAQHIGKPVPKMLVRVRQWLLEGKRVKIFTARVGPERVLGERAVALNAITNWSKKYIGQELEVTHEKDYSMVELWDDRAIQVEKNTGIRVDGKN